MNAESSAESSRSSSSQEGNVGLSESLDSDSGKGKGKSTSNGNNGNGDTHPAIDFTAGVIAGAAGLVVGQPFDVVKVRYQTPQYAGRYTSTFGALGAIVKEEKVKGLFKGVTSPMAGIAFINGIVFTSYSFFMKLQLPADSQNEPSLGQIFLAGAGSGVVSSTLTSPIELIKIREQSAPPHVNTSTIGVVKHILRTDGLRGLFRGFGATAMRDLAYGPYFFTYEALLRLFKYMKTPPLPESSRRHEGHTLIDEAEMELSSGLSWPELMAAGGIAGVTAWLATFPLDVLKTRLQSAEWSTTPSTATAAAASASTSPSAILSKAKRPSLWTVGRDAVRQEGWRVMFAGLGPTLIR
ncbi:carnitine/acyl carnitine carrier [Kwoniella heveanensis CBS 569]|uniref:Carnitine/acyl carnitine carrier n=1 Tax=Kwoniella heveanensis BCC8398 TaxID=1296120 RepID=A0A1B9GRK1_9TREE|nr:carnitine/acyl carnitine carrier [Kwoniella heveanensis BCC8398]OCF43617.1 carnitine/acyl carnitine carrier [Kwoniella heveanensis CBS 569]